MGLLLQTRIRAEGDPRSTPRGESTFARSRRILAARGRGARREELGRVRIGCATSWPGLGVVIKDSKDGTTWESERGPQIAFRPFFPPTPPAARQIFRDAIEFSAADDYDDDQRAAWAARADDEAAFGAKLAKELTIVATLEGFVVAFASLEGSEKLDMLYVDPAAGRRGVGAALVDALARLAAGRGAKRIAAEASDDGEAAVRPSRLRRREPQPRAARRPVACLHFHDQGARRIPRREYRH